MEWDSENRRCYWAANVPLLLGELELHPGPQKRLAARLGRELVGRGHLLGFCEGFLGLGTDEIGRGGGSIG